MTLETRSALAGAMAPGRHGKAEGAAGVTVRERANPALASVIARKGQAASLAALVKSAYGLDLPTAPQRVAMGLPDGRAIAFIWAGPEQWLAAGEGMEDIERELVAALGNRAMIADQGDGRCLLRIRGPKARATLAKGAPIDLDPRVFKPGDVAMTQIHHIGVHLWQIDDAPTYEIACFRSLAGSLWSWLEASAAEFGCEVVADAA